MIRRFVIAAFAAVSIISFTSCEEVIEFNGKYDGEKLVLFSCANPDSPLFHVALSKSRFFLDASQNQHPFDVSGGEVLLTAGGNTYKLIEDTGTPGSFLTDFVPEEGSRIILEAKAPGFSPVRSEVTVPSRVRFEVVPGAQKIVSDSEWGMQVERHFKIIIHDDGNARNYYRISAFQEVDVKDGMLYAETDSLAFGTFRQGALLMTNDVAFMGTDDMEAIAGIIEDGSTFYIEGVFDDSFINGRDYTFEVWVEDYLRKFEGESYGGERDLIPVEVHPEDYSGWGFEIDALSEDIYKYQRSRDDYRRSDMGLGSVFGEPVSIHNNILGGIGCFGAITPSLVMF